ncbi:MAG TPA: thiamine phosphate synthase [Candidatus Kapabacteria bacterium]|jgi:thiamine-phosphate pyrophosphorylase|nr:thiamine phosphate synthase [Candidatus Kapabacteria bacterium]
MLDFRLFAIGSSLPCVDESPALAVEQFHRYADAGIRAYQLRQKIWTDRMRFNTAQQLVASSARYNARIFVNERADIAIMADAAGVHLPETGINISCAKRIAPNKLAGISCHSIIAARKAEEDGADYIFFGPIFDTESKRAFGLPLGLNALREVCKEISVPVFAIGGITSDRAAECRAIGVHGVAVIGALADAKSLSNIVKEFQNALGEL